ncbi:hypothetical protein NL676_037234 [Syzygium grande]|nr:hypothetical protein NL676_037234 [Syzygium grande]
MHIMILRLNYFSLSMRQEISLYLVFCLAEALDMQPPVMHEDGHTTRMTSGEDASSAAAKDSSLAEPLWDDGDTRAFYECLPDLRNQQLIRTRSSNAQERVEISVEPGSSQEGKVFEKGKDKEEKDKEEKDKEKTKDMDKEKGKEKEVEKKVENEKEKVKGLEGTSLDALVQRLPGCVSWDLIDQLMVEFCYVNSKSNRKRLDVSTMLLQMLEEFNFLINKKDQMNIETKIRNIRFIGELCKFMIAPAGLVFSCLKACLDDFTHHNIDVACNLPETCGCFLYRSPETTVRMANMLEILMRLKNVKNLDPRHSTLVENAYYLCKPPERSARVTKVRPPLHQYIRKLLFSDLDKSTIKHVLRQLPAIMMNLPWPLLMRFWKRLGLELNDYGMQQRRVAHMCFLGELYNYEHLDSSVIFETLHLILVFGHGTAEDLFADLRPNMTRYSSIEEVNAALEENGEVHEDIADSDTDSSSSSIDIGRDEEELDDDNPDDGCVSEDDKDEDDDARGSASDEDEVHVRQKIPEVDPLEEANFEWELKAVLQESMEQRRLELRGWPTINMMVPMSVFEGSTKDHHGRGLGRESGDEAVDEEGGGSKEIQVKVLVKRGNKQQTKQMYIPRDSSLVQSTKQKEAAELEEKQDIKRLVLEYNDREEEELNGLGTQALNWSQSGGSRVISRG